MDGFCFTEAHKKKKKIITAPTEWLMMYNYILQRWIILDASQQNLKSGDSDA